MPGSSDYKERLKKKDKRDKERVQDESGTTKPRRRKRSKEPPEKGIFSLTGAAERIYNFVAGTSYKEKEATSSSESSDQESQDGLSNQQQTLPISDGPNLGSENVGPRFQELSIPESECQTQESFESFEVVQNQNQNSPNESEPSKPSLSPVSQLVQHWESEPKPRHYRNPSNENSHPDKSQNKESFPSDTKQHSNKNRPKEYNENDFSDQYQNSESRQAQQNSIVTKTQTRQPGSYPNSDGGTYMHQNYLHNSNFVTEHSRKESDSRNYLHNTKNPESKTTLDTKTEPEGMFSFKEMKEQLNDAAHEPVKTLTLKEPLSQNLRPTQQQYCDESTKNTEAYSHSVDTGANVTVKEMAQQLDKTSEKLNDDNIGKRLRSSKVSQNSTKMDEINQKNSVADSKWSNFKSEAKASEPSKKIALLNYKHSHQETDIQVVFEVLLSSEMKSYGCNVNIVFGPPLSNWNTAMVKMKQKETPETIRSGNYLYLAGVLPLNIDYKCKSIPYKYVVQGDGGNVEWEYIDLRSDSNINRCLVVPDKVHKFTKFDDVILPKLTSKNPSVNQLQRNGREIAVKWMLPRPNDFTNQDFDFETTLEKHKGVVKSFGNNGMKVCEGDNPKGYFNPQAFNIEFTVSEQLRKMFDHFRKCLKENDFQKILRLGLYLSLISTTKYLNIEQLDQFLPFFEAFKLCGTLLFDPAQLPKSITGEIQNQITGALKKLVKDFVNLQVNVWCQEDYCNRGNWFFAIPFIHRWDLSGEKLTDWLCLTTWKQNLRTRNYSSLAYLDFVSVMKAADPKLDRVFVEMLENVEIEKLISEDADKCRLFTVARLLGLLSLIIQTSKRVPQACDIVKKRLQEEGERMQNYRINNDGQVSQEDTNYIKNWLSVIHTIIKDEIPASKKSVLVNFFLDFVLVVGPFADMAELISELTQTINVDLYKGPLFATLCKNWSEYLTKMTLINKKMHTELLTRFKKHVFSVISPDDCFETFLTEGEMISAEISDALFDRAVVMFQEKKDANVLSKLYSIGKSWLVGDTSKAKNLSRLFRRCIDDLQFGGMEDVYTVVRISTDLPSTSNMMKFYSKLKDSNLLNRFVVQKADLILNQTEQFMIDLDEGNITLEICAMLKDDSRVVRLLNLYEYHHDIRYNGGRFSSDRYKKLIKTRLAEMEEYLQAGADLTNFKSKFETTREGIEEIDELMSQFSTDLSSVSLKSVCRIRNNLDAFIVLKLQQISPEQLQVVRRHLSLYKTSSIFRQIHEKVNLDENKAKENVAHDMSDEDDTDEDDSVEEVVQVSEWTKLVDGAEEMFARFDSFVDRLSDLETSISEVQEFFEDIYSKKRLMDDLAVLEEHSERNGWAKQAEASIIRLFTIKQYSNAANAIIKAAEALGRPTSFEVVEKILKATQGEAGFLNQPLKIINEELVKAGKTFSTWTPDQVGMLLSLTKSGKIIKWLKENFKDRTDIKGFYELATISAGESDLEVDKVSNFYQSVTGFSPLILDLNIQNCTFDAFLSACSSVFAVLARDDKIADKLIDSNRNLEWIKECKKQQGSVEQTSMTMVSKINETGIYKICMPSGKAASLKTIQKCVKMSYQKVAIQIGPKVLAEVSLDDLQELRSKLMLITAGTDGKKEVDRFTRLFSLVELVTKHFIALENAGCHLFSHWKLQVFCDPKKKVKVTSDFGHKTGGLQHGVNQVEIELKHVADFLKSTLDEWSAHVSRLRNNYPTLNFFTTDQLVILSAQLAKLIYANLPVTPQAAILLNLVGPGLSKLKHEELANFARLAMKDEQLEEIADAEMNIEEAASDSEDSMDQDTDQDEPDDPFQNLKSQSSYLKLLEDYNGNLALASMIKCGTDNIDGLMDWCFDHSDDCDEEIENILTEYLNQNRILKEKSVKKPPTEKPKRTATQSRDAKPQPEIVKPDVKKFVEYSKLIKFSYDVNTEGLLSEKLKDIWNQFLQKVESLEITDYLSFQAMAKCLQEMSRRFGTNPSRKFLPTLTEGSPNLVVCPDSEMHVLALSYYMFDPIKALPSLDEVLICQSNTPLEQIELLCRRAFTDESGKIYIIMHAERMSYDSGMLIEQLIKNTTVTNHQYRLIFMASKEKNDHSYIVTAFDKYRSQLTSLPNPDKVQGYLLEQLQSDSPYDRNNLMLRIVKSKESGNGKSLVAQRLSQSVQNSKRKILQLHENEVDFGKIISTWIKAIEENTVVDILHLDVTPAVHTGRADLIFSLSVLRGLSDSSGQLWINTQNMYYIIELTCTHSKNVPDQQAQAEGKDVPLIPFEDYVPSITCLSPEETAQILAENPGLSNVFLQCDRRGDWTFLFDHETCVSDVYQRPYLYLSQMKDSARRGELDFCRYIQQPKNITKPLDCLKIVLENCPVKNPTWMELTHFVSFLNCQLTSSENSTFCNPDLIREEFPGMKTFVLKFLLQMSKDFATKSVKISDQSQGKGFSKPVIKDRKSWEKSPHPYIFFNEDGDTMSFFGFRLDPHLRLIEERSGAILMENIMTRALYDGLRRNGVVFNQEFDKTSEDAKVSDLCKVFGIGVQMKNPDITYELTSDNVMKLLAIYMRFRSSIPVVIMGETGSGKTRLIKFMCDLIHTGKEAEKILGKLKQAEDYLEKVQKSRSSQGPRTSEMQELEEAEDLLRIVKTGKSFIGQLRNSKQVQIRIAVADALVQRLKLGVDIRPHVGKKSQVKKPAVNNLIIMKTHGGVTEENIHSLVREAIDQARENMAQGIPLTVVFFDEANTTNAIGTIKEVMCDRLVNGDPIPEDIGLQFVAAVNPYREHSDDMIKKLENAGLGYHIKCDKTFDKLGKIPMRRLVYRVREIPASMFPLIWDFGTLDAETEKKYIIQMITSQIAQKRFDASEKAKLLLVLCRSQSFMRERKDECSFVSLRDVERMLTTLEWFHRHENIISIKILEKLSPNSRPSPFALFTINLILALGVSYFSRLDERRLEFEEEMTGSLLLQNRYFSRVITTCQDIFIDELNLEQTIAKNDALKENVWMMAICIDLRIPLFLVGKPGSSKSLAKTVITDVMQGEASYSDLFKNLKEIHMVSFQCSPLATAGGILSAFRQCQKFQEKGGDLNKFAAVCVLDEVGLAEDSPKMPLKALHPLLEDGCVESEKPDPHKKVAFVGISNWALDPAKMNRGILLSRGVPNKKDLIKSAEGICASDRDALRLMKATIDLLAEGYYEVYEKQKREYFGLRDFYSLVKMVNAQVRRKQTEPTNDDVTYAVQRNFGGFFGDFKPAHVFLSKIYPTIDEQNFMPPKALITEAIKQEGETRYILLLTKNNAALNIIQEQELLSMKNTSIIFGSSFVDDQEYRQICLNINRIKIAMELGHTVILCNLNNLYESLYDALNQNYTMMSGSRYVDLGLGTHRVKCRIHPNFRLVLIAEDDEVYEKFPIPLINRLEKHYLGMETMLTEDSQLKAVFELKKWLNSVSEVNLQPFRQTHFQQFSPCDVFVGYHDDAPASVVLRLSKEEDSTTESVIEQAKSIFLKCATPDAISRLSETRLDQTEKTKISEVFYSLQKDSLAEAIHANSGQQNLMQVTTFSRLLTNGGRKEICSRLGRNFEDIQMITLQQINTEEQFTERIHTFLDICKISSTPKVLIVQGQINPDTPHSLVECTRYSILNQVLQHKDISNQFCIILVLQVPRVYGGFFTGFPGMQWKALHIDELCGDPNNMRVDKWSNKTLNQVLESEEKSNLRQLIAECVPKAASLAYKSDDLSSGRITNCIDIIRKYLSENDQDFITALCSKVLEHMKQNAPTNQPEKWMAHLAISSIHLKEGNTFARSVWLHLVDKVSRHLAQVIATCDLFSGFEHLVDPNEWIQKGYIKILSVVDLSTISAAKGSFRSRFPFSWAIEIQLDKLHRGDDDEDGSLYETFLQSPLGSTVEKMFQESSELSELFLFDLLRYKIDRNMNEKTMELLCMEVFRLSKATAVDRIKNSFEDAENFEVINLEQIPISPVDVFKTVVALKPRLQIIVLLFSLIPCLEQKMTPTHEEDFTLDILALKTAFEKLLPDVDKILNDTVRIDWGSKITSLATYLKQLDGLVKRGAATDKTRAMLDALWKECHRAEILKLFFEHTMLASIDERIKISVCDSQNIKSFWVALKDLDFSTRPKNFNFFLKAIEKCCRKAGDVFLGYKGVQECLICLEAIKVPAVLPCKHVGCKACLVEYFDTSETRKCPKEGCKEIVPGDFGFKSAIDLKKAVKEHSQFRIKISQFFLDVLQRFVFVKERPPHQDIIDILLSFIVTKNLPKEQVQKTKNLSPFPGDYIDPKPVIRSFVLQLLFRYDISTIKDHLNKFLKSKRPFVETQDQYVDLCIMIVQCLEDSFAAKNRKSALGHIHQIKSAMDHMQKHELTDDHVKLLWNTALDRLAINTVAEAINSYLSKEIEAAAIADLLEVALNFFKQHNESSNLKKYLVRQVAAKYQLESVVQWKKQNVYLDLLPDSLRLSNENDAPDNYLHLDPNYKEVRNSITKAWLSKDYDQLAAVVEEFKGKPIVWGLAFHHLTRVKTCEIKDLASFEQFLLQHPWLANIWRSSQDNLIPALIGQTPKHSSCFNLLVHFRQVLSQNQMSPFLVILSDLAQKPMLCANLFLPTMPHDETLEVKAALTEVLGWFSCVNGHAYAIGECFRPTHLSKCLTCGVDVGGEEYNVFAGTGRRMEDTAQAVLKDETKAGHILGAAEVGQRSFAVRGISGLDVAIIRFLLHAAMMEGFRAHPDELRPLIDPQPNNVGQFLANHMCLNLTQISKCLGKNTTEAIILLHQVISNLGEFKLPHLAALNSKDSVKQWETEFSQRFIAPAQQVLDVITSRQSLAIKEDAVESVNALQDILHEDDQLVNNDEVKLISLTQFWRPWDNICIERIVAKVGNEEKLKEKCPFLSELLQKEKILQELSHLPQLLELVQFLYKIYNRQLEIGEADQMSIAEFTSQKMDFVDRKYANPLIENFLYVLKTCKQELFAFGEMGARVHKILGDCDLNMTCPSSILFPASHGFGLTSTVLIQFLIEPHNFIVKKFLDCQINLVETKVDLPVVSCREIVDSSLLVSVDAQDLHLALVANSEYNVGVGEARCSTKWVLNEVGLEQHVVDKFISGKPLIDVNTVPCFVYRLDHIGGQGLEELKAKIPQFDSIPSTAIGVQLESELPEIRDISSLLDILQTTVDTLALVGGNNHDSLSKKIHQLKITSFKGRIKLSLPKSLDNFKLGHLEALMVNLRFVRAKRMVHNNHPPFHKADKVFYEQLPEELLPSIDEMLHHVQPELMAIELLDFIHVWIEDKFEATEDGFEDREFVHYFEAHLERNDVKNVQDLIGHIHQKILIKHAISVFVIVARKILERN